VNELPGHPPGHIPGVHVPGTLVPIGAAVHQLQEEQAGQARQVAERERQERMKRRRANLLLTLDEH